MQHAPNRHEKRLITENPPGEPVTVAECQDELGEALFVVGEIQRLVGTYVLLPDRGTMPVR